MVTEPLCRLHTKLKVVVPAETLKPRDALNGISSSFKSTPISLASSCVVPVVIEQSATTVPVFLNVPCAKTITTPALGAVIEIE